MNSLPAPLFASQWPAHLDSEARDRSSTEARAWPRLTVVTPSFNQGQFLETTIRSILAQGYPNLEYFVIDGGSRDDSVSVIQHYEKFLSGWVSEPDSGQVDAILKGLKRATGDWFIWINSDDILAPDALWAVAEAALRAPEADMIAGSTRNFTEHVRRSHFVSKKLDARNVVLEEMRSGACWHQPSIWMRRAHLLDVGASADLHYRFDYDLMIRYLHRYPRVHYLRRTLVYFRLHGASKTVSLAPKFRAEHVEVLQRLARDTEFSMLGADIDLALRGLHWASAIDELVDDRSRSRWQRLRQLIAGVRQDPAARCSVISRRAVKRLLFYGGRPRR